ncbi:MAG: hypothetical protein JW974_03505 [Alphaproteobacteria bacterium]|nr:hypothetical protein [Alphaproteobacteria bacterium]MBN2675305.1 hypothetical protein [Alphaproteobacteria bacterium]
MKKVKNYSLINNDICEIDKPQNDYVCVYAPKSIKINVKSATIIFCGIDTEVKADCEDIFRGDDWYIENSYVYNKRYKRFKYDLVGNSKDFDLIGAFKKFNDFVKKEEIYKMKEIDNLIRTLKKISKNSR